MINTILFDLDGTLLPLDMEQFVAIYFKELGLVFQDMIEPKTLVKNIWNATEAMVQSINNQTNEQVFMERFGELVGAEILPVYQERFTKFYDAGFLNTRKSVIPVPSILESVSLLKEKGYDLIIATNPLFPEKAIHHRIRWAGFTPEIFSYITSYERNHYCKPQLNFYHEILQETHKTPGQCLMVGNDVQEDLIAGNIGISTFLITDHLIHRESKEISCNYKGDYQAFHDFAISLPNL